jgi:3-oxoacyl-(acyl-carrier-protein) synthase
MARAVAVTGVGLLSAFGCEITGFWDGLMSGRCAVRPVDFSSAGRDWTQFVAPIGEIPVPQCVSPTERNFYKQLPLAAVYCAERALIGARLCTGEIDPHRAGVVFGSGFINLYDLESMYERYFDEGQRAVSPLTIPLNMPNTPVARVSIKFGLRGVTKTVSSACSSATSAIVEAYRLVRDGRQDVMLAGGIDLVSCPTIVTCWERMRVLAPASGDPAMACRPFDRDRSGLVLGEGGALFVLEDMAHARARGAPVLAELAGASETADGFDLVKPSQDGEVRCMRGALEAAGLAPAAIDVVHAHGTGTRLNDQVEYESMREVFGVRVADLPLCAIKSMIGHGMGASGAFNLAAALGSVRRGDVYPVPNFTAADDGVALNVGTEGRRLEDVEHVLVNTFAFGGINTCLIVSRADDAAARASGGA